MLAWSAGSGRRAAFSNCADVDAARERVHPAVLPHFASYKRCPPVNTMSASEELHLPLSELGGAPRKSESSSMQS